MFFRSFVAVLVVVVVVVAEPPVRVNSKFSREFQSQDGRAFQPILLRPLGGQLVLLEQLQSAPPVVSNPQNDIPQTNVEDNERNSTGSTRNLTESAPATPVEVSRNEKLTKKEDEGVYYIYHPNGLLQKVVYATNDDVEKMAFSARLKYENVEPIREPIYTYDPETYVFKRI